MKDSEERTTQDDLAHLENVQDSLGQLAFSGALFGAELDELERRLDTLEDQLGVERLEEWAEATLPDPDELDERDKHG